VGAGGEGGARALTGRSGGSKLATIVTHEREHEAGSSGSSLFSRVLVGVDGSEAGFEACRQAVRLAEPGSLIDVIAVVHVSDEVRAFYEMEKVTDRLQDEAAEALGRSVQLIGRERARPRVVNGLVTAALVRELEAATATLLVIGTHGHRRMTEILIGGVMGELLHGAPCSILVARGPVVPDHFPRSIVVGVDGSTCSEYALHAAEQLARRFQLPLRVVAATQSDDVDFARVRRWSPGAEAIDGRPSDALVTASRGADLLVVGSRGLRGIHALGSVSERVAHHASCSVLVARPVDEGPGPASADSQ
jgi:nucleotide-binding universal stress UspA family protein